MEAVVIEAETEVGAEPAKMDRQLRRVRTVGQREEAAGTRAFARAFALQRAADAAEEAMTLNELVAQADNDKRAAKRATRRVLRRLV